MNMGCFLCGVLIAVIMHRCWRRLTPDAGGAVLAFFHLTYFIFTRPTGTHYWAGFSPTVKPETAPARQEVHPRSHPRRCRGRFGRPHLDDKGAARRPVTDLEAKGTIARYPCDRGDGAMSKNSNFAIFEIAMISLSVISTALTVWLIFLI